MQVETKYIKVLLEFSKKVLHEKTFSELREREIKVKDNLLEVEVKIMQKITKDTKVFNPLPLHISLSYLSRVTGSIGRQQQQNIEAINK